VNFTLLNHELYILVFLLTMAAHERPIKASIASPTLLLELASVLPKDVRFKIYHLSTPPTRASALYSAPPGARPDRTYCESHFLSASIITSLKDEPSEKVDVLVFAIEVLIYSTAYDSTFFVSKADSTGFLHLLNLPKGAPSPLRDISGCLLRYLVEHHQREHIRSVVSLFARAQDQYLFPGSVDYSGKHVLDDRGLVRWWCRVLNPLIKDMKSPRLSDTPQWEEVKGYLIVPGLDAHETISYIPKDSKSQWIMGHPLQLISRHASDVPPRCLIPHFPDDPKARYLVELDDEIAKGRNSANGQWKSVKSIDQFWDMMAFRQECSAGRLVGFIWIVFEPTVQHRPTDSINGDSQSSAVVGHSQTWDIESAFPPCPNLSFTPSTSFNTSSQIPPTSSPWKLDNNEPPIASQQSARSSKPSNPKKKKLTGPIIPRQPRVKTENKNYLLERPESTAYYIWKPEARGQVIVEESDYKRITELLLRLDFATLELASSSSRRWINEVRSGASGSMSEAWGQTVVGTKVVEIQTVADAAGATTLNMGLVRKKRKGAPEELKGTPPTVDSTPQVSVLATSMVRKKPKT
jgi:regulator of Ty1 transposition protein 109